MVEIQILEFRKIKKVKFYKSIGMGICRNLKRKFAEALIPDEIRWIYENQVVESKYNKAQVLNLGVCHEQEGIGLFVDCVGEDGSWNPELHPKDLQ